MDEKKICIAGSGGQGVLLLSKVLATAGMLDKKNVTLISSYGAEMRGGIINCTVIISDEDIGSPIAKNPDILIAMNNYAVQKYGPKIASGGLLIANESLIHNSQFLGNNIKAAFLPATEIAKTSSGHTKLTNMIMLGALLQKTKLLPLQNIQESIKFLLPAKNQNLICLNLEALHEGMGYFKEKVYND
jgi:2-oxoglutarate ferredoxin oxidoreductase subunit gamma